MKPFSRGVRALSLFMRLGAGDVREWETVGHSHAGALAMSGGMVERFCSSGTVALPMSGETVEHSRSSRTGALAMSRGETIGALTLRALVRGRSHFCV